MNPNWHNLNVYLSTLQDKIRCVVKCNSLWLMLTGRYNYIRLSYVQVFKTIHMYMYCIALALTDKQNYKTLLLTCSKKFVSN